MKGPPAAMRAVSTARIVVKATRVHSPRRVIFGSGTRRRPSRIPVAGGGEAKRGAAGSPVMRIPGPSSHPGRPKGAGPAGSRGSTSRAPRGHRATQAGSSRSGQKVHFSTVPVAALNFGASWGQAQVQ